MPDSRAQPFRISSAGFLAAHMARLFIRALTAAQQPLGIAAAQFVVLTELWQADGLTQRDLVAKLDLEQATIGNTLARMERDLLIIRRPHPYDGRAQLIFLSERGRQLEAPALEAAREVNRRALAELTYEESAMFLNLMNRVIGTLAQMSRNDA